MNFFSTLLHAGVGFLTGGPLGAGIAVAGDLAGELSQPSGGGGQPGTPAPVSQVLSLKPNAQTDQHSSEAFLRAYLNGGGSQSTVFDAQKALGPLQQRANQEGGRSSVPGGDGGVPFKKEPLGGGRGGGGPVSKPQPQDKANWFDTARQNALNAVHANSTPAATAPAAPDANTQWRQAFAATQSANQGRYTNGLQAGFGNYMNNALAGNSGLPQANYDAALGAGMHTINAQAAQSNAALQNALGSRGLANSGMMGSGMLGIEQARLAGFGQLTTGLAQQDLQARRESQQNAAGMMPSLIGADTQASTGAWQGLLAQRQLELEALRIGISQQQVDDARRSGNYNILADLVSTGVQYLNGRNNNSNSTYTPNPYAGQDIFI